MEIFRLVFSPIQVNTYIFTDKSGECAVIDCGCYGGSESGELEEFLRSKKLNPVLLLNTHCHLDHIFGNRFMLEKYNLKALCSRNDEMNRNNAVQHALMFGLTMERPPEPGGYLTDKQIVTFGTTSLEVIEVPGHAPGSLAFYSLKDKCVFTGDALFSGSIGRTDLPGGDYDTLIESIGSRLFVLPTDTVVYPGHGEATTIGREIKTNPFFRE
jgi:hydroxyacylglutathione hydrolase